MHVYIFIEIYFIIVLFIICIIIEIFIDKYVIFDELILSTFVIFLYYSFICRSKTITKYPNYLFFIHVR
jgi:hypothetical protein